MRSYGPALVGALVCVLIATLDSASDTARIARGPVTDMESSYTWRQKHGVHWHKSLEAARKSARKSKKPLLAMFRCDP